MSGPAVASETVIVVHGTFSGKAPDATPRWYAPGQAFCVQLDKALESRGSAARCWQHLQSGEDYFYWDGANDWLSRLKAATRLRRELQRLHGKGQKAHLVGHSHGGSVIVDAITNDLGRVEPWFDGRVVLLGTPLYRDSGTFSERRKKLLTRWSVISLVAWALLLFLSARQVNVFAAFALGSPTEYWAQAIGMILAGAAIVLLVRALRPLVSDYRWRYAWLRKLVPSNATEPKMEMRRSPAFMLINSRFDEAYRSLSGLPQGINPLVDAAGQRKRGFASHLRAVADSGRSSLAALVAETLDTHHTGVLIAIGVASVLTALFWRIALQPFSPGTLSALGASLGFWAVTTVIVVTACVFDRFVFFPGIVLTDGLAAMWRGVVGLAALSFDARIKASVWGFMKSFGLGLSGAPRRAEDIAVSLMFEATDPEDCVYLELPEAMVSAVTQTQKGRLEEIQDILYQRTATWSPAEIREELESVDFPLVHTIYYREEACIQKIADWLCEPVVKELDGRRKLTTMVPRGPSYGGLQNMTIEEIESTNAYRLHVEELKQRHGPSDSAWGTRTNFDTFSKIKGRRGSGFT